MSDKKLIPCKKCGSNKLTTGEDRDGSYVFCECSPTKFTAKRVWNEVNKPDPIPEPTVLVSELRKYCEAKLNRLSIIRNMDYHYYKKFTDELLAKFCEVKE